MRRAISADKRLAITLKYLATGESFFSLASQFGIGDSTVSSIVKTTNRAIISTLKPFVQIPTTISDWQKISTDFYDRWNYPNCIGALDGKHIVVQKPPKSGSDYYNYKGTFSIVLMALADANYRYEIVEVSIQFYFYFVFSFIYVDVGANGKVSDATIWENSKLKESVLNKSLGIPPSTSLPGTTTEIPHHFIGDDIFPLTNYMMKPYPRQKNIIDIERRIFDYRFTIYQSIES
jgi:hypothetical protein